MIKDLLKKKRAEIGLFLAEEKLITQRQKYKNTAIDARLARIETRIDRMVEAQVRKQRRDILRACGFVHRRKSQTAKMTRLMCTWSLGVPAGFQTLERWWNGRLQKYSASWSAIRQTPLV